MAYELIVRRVGAVPVDALRALTQREPWYELVGDAGGVLLTNNNTGVYVTIAPRKRSEDLVYAVNFRRPRFFAVEALLTLQRLAGEFGWHVEDPQRGTRLTFDAHDCAQSVARWDEWNAAAPVPSRGVPIDAQHAMRVWRWNFQRPLNETEMQNNGAALAIPGIFFTARKGEPARTMAFWPAGVSGVVLPDVDAVVVRDGAGDAGAVVDRSMLDQRAAYYTRMAGHDGVAVFAAADSASMQSLIESAKREPFTGHIVSSDMLREEA